MEDDTEGIVFPNGDRYLGESLENNECTPHGLGICYYADGKHYDGEWKNGSPNGRGIIYLPNGEGHGGKWVNGELMEKTTKIFINGDCYIGELKDDFPDGEGKFTEIKGKIFEGKFRKGTFIAGILTLPNGKIFPILENQHKDPIERSLSLDDKNQEWTQPPENWEKRQKDWVKEKFLDPDVYPPEEGNTTYFSKKFSDEEIIELAELNPGFGLKRFVKILYPKAKSSRTYEYEFTMLFSDFKDAFGVDILNHLEDKRYSKLVTGDEYLKITGKKYLPSGYRRSTSRISSIERKGSPGEGVKIPLKPQKFVWGDITPENERTNSSI